MNISKTNISDKRHYKRLDNIFPVEFQFAASNGEEAYDWQQAFSQDIGAGGLRLVVNHLTDIQQELLKDENIRINMRIHLPVGIETIKAKGRVVWFKKNAGTASCQYSIGVEYEHISQEHNVRIMRYCSSRAFLKGVAIIFVFVLGFSLITAGFYNTKLRFDNERLVEGLAKNLENQRVLQEGQLALSSKITDMKELLEQSEKKSQSLEVQLKEVKADDQKAIADLQLSLESLRLYQQKLKGNITDLSFQKTKADKEALKKEKEVFAIEGQVKDKLYRWLLSHRNNRTGLVASFEGDGDVADWGFTYDQALAAMNFVNFGDIESAKKLFDFYTRAKRIDGGGFANAYFASSGEPVEFTAHVGPNAWLGLAIMQYTHKTHDKKYMSLVLDISRWLETMKDSEGGLRGGKNFSWYSTEHNLDSYAFYNMLFDITQDERYKKRAQQLLEWLNKNAYSNVQSSVIKRGKGDSTIATDTYAWSILSVGPKVLKEAGMDPDGIIDFAMENCAVNVTYQKFDGSTVDVKGFDFAKHQNLARGGVVSCEWTAQMSLALKMMADFWRNNGDEDKANRYAQLASMYISELSKMVITSPSPVGQGGFCLPYASHEFTDTGHGWRTPKGNRTGSVAGTAYTIFAIDGFNPLVFNEK